MLWSAESCQVDQMALTTNEDVVYICGYVARQGGADLIAIEMIASYGMPVGREVFETCVWIGRFVQAACALPCEYVYRKDVKLYLCGNARAKDSNVRQAIIDRFGGKDKAIGRKKNPGPLHGVKGDLWAALAVGLYVADSMEDNGIVFGGTATVSTESQE
jgi:hypothetical protein